MKIREIEIKGWRSYDDEKGIILKDLKRINILIGPNNSGKSNLGKYFLLLKNILSLRKYNPDLSLSDQNDNVRNISKEIETQDTWACSNNNIQCFIKIDVNNTKWSISEPVFPKNKAESVKLEITHRVPKKENSFNHKKENTSGAFIEESLKVNRNIDEFIASMSDNTIYWHEFYEGLVFIDPVRDHRRKTDGTGKDFYFDGSEIEKQLTLISDNDKDLWQEFEGEIETWLEILLNEKIEFRLAKNDLRFIFKRSKKKITANLEHLGTGVSQLFMILAYLFINREKELNIFIDEPEANLHPEAVRKLIQIFEKDFPNHSFFITTHSSVLIDQINDKNWSVHRVVRKGDEATQIFPCNLIVQKYEMLDDLGIRASQLLQTNLIIWVEGPSDKIYIKKWILDIAKKQGLEFEEGKHFSFLMYGGSNLSSHSILSKDFEDYFDILCTSRYSVIVCDSDYDCEETARKELLKSRVTKIKERLSELKKDEIGLEKNISDYIKFWISDGRETENYIPKELFDDVLSSLFIRDHIKVGETYEVVKIKDKPEIASIPFGKYDSFDCTFSNIYKFENNSELDEIAKKNIADFYSKKKVKISKEIVTLWKDEHYNTLDLRTEIQKIVDLIITANGIEHA